MSREDKYTDSSAIAMDKMAKRVSERLEREVGYEWDERPILTDLWRMYKFLADAEEAHSKMIHGNIATILGEPDLISEVAQYFMPDNAREIIDEVKEINERLKAITEEWNDHKWRLTEIADEFRKAQDDHDRAEDQAKREEQARKKRVAELRKAGRLGF